MNENVPKGNVDEAAGERSEEEVAWDKEFKDEYQDSSFASALGDMVKLAIKIPAAIIQMPMSIIPEETARHTRAAFRESFLAFRSLLGAIGDGIENILAEPDNTSTPAGPDGTWGPGRTPRPKADAPSSVTPSSGRAKRITLSDDDAADSSGQTSAGDSDAADDDGSQEGRGLRADIEY